jgi:hypothetical protein
VSIFCRHTVGDAEVTSDAIEGIKCCLENRLRKWDGRKEFACILRSSQARARRYRWLLNRLNRGG